MSRDGLMWGLALGGGALALMAMGRDAKASTDGEGGAAPAMALPPPSGPLPERAIGAALPAWNRKAGPDDAPLYIGDDVEALARVITSEVGSGPVPERVAIGWVARNRALRRGVGIARLVCQPCGKSTGNLRPFSTARPATRANRELAVMILASPQTDDPTGGATSCFEPGLQDRLFAAGRKGHSLDARGVRACWLRELDYYGSVGRWDLFGAKGGKGARPVPSAWQVASFTACCPRDQRAACMGKQPGDQLEA